ncbi:site-specific integrase [Chryseolinea lacunae]|uniref:Site-specific integrase n=1 Tax=Chryseolinea lacunae TaxID=2801331 RepID=A0ABS1KSD7_9BACT|nr:site-specific integrase [Chryseolinea lacunae]MBL0742108.1 site-specific integrase [Chryseolinea lacunae]
MNATISVLFFARKSKPNHRGEVPIYMRVTLNGERYDLGTKRFIPIQNWSVEAGKAKGNSEIARSINSFLETLRAKAFDHQRQILVEGKPLTLQEFKNRWQGISSERSRMLMEIFEQHNGQMKSLVNREFSPLTLERYITSKKHTQEFMNWKYKVNDIDIKKLNYEFITDYEFWLKSVRRCDHNTAMKYLSNFKKIVNLCIKNGWLDRDPFVGFKMSKREVERPFLLEGELEKITKKEFNILRIKQVRDVFVFCCYTGLSYADVEKLTRDEITTGIDGEKWIWTKRQKTDTATRVPLLPQALEILNRYSADPQCLNNEKLLPVLSNQKMNTYLKEIADACGITKKMTFHTARHTFATTVTLTNGVPIETVSKMLGHRNLKTTQHYAKILDIKVSNDMTMLKERLQSNMVATNSTIDNKDKS